MVHHTNSAYGTLGLECCLGHDSLCSLVISDTQVNTQTTDAKSESHQGVSLLVLNCDTPTWLATVAVQMVPLELNAAFDHDSLCSLVISDAQVNMQTTAAKSEDQWGVNLFL